MAKRSRARTVSRIYRCRRILAAFARVVSPGIDSIVGVVVGWFVAILIATVIGGLVAGKRI